jgi:hypothetical protein
MEHIPRLQPLLDRMVQRQAVRDSARDSDVDGRPPTGRYGHDSLLDALIREHPDMIPAELLDEIATSRRRVSF